MNACLRALLAAALLSPALAAAQADSPVANVSLWPASPTPGEPFRVELSGSWAKSCAPSVARAWIEGHDIVLQLHEGAKACKGQPRSALTLRSAEPGESTLVASEPGVYRVRAVAGQDERTLAFALAEIGTGNPPIRPESGLWWPERGGEFETSGPGLGAQVELQGDLVALNLSGYGDSGHPTWWFAAQPLDGATQRLELTTLHGGAGPFADYRAPQQVASAGSLYVEWIGSGRAVFWFTRPLDDGSLDVRPISMTRFRFGSTPGASWRGQWVLMHRDAAGNAASELIEFTQLAPREDGFDLGNAGGASLSCSFDARRPDSPPAECQLLTADGDVASFRSIGLNRLEGRSDDGRRDVVLLKLQES